MSSIIEMKNIYKIYGTDIKTTVLDNINLQFEKGSFNSIIGQSGSGKSTLLNIMGTLDQPTSGDIFLNGEKVSKISKNKLAVFRNSQIGFVFQFHYLLPEFTALENVKNNMATKMSGGQQQRTAIARALINEPEIILADEPTGNLDSDSTNNIYELLRNINLTFGTSFIIITHDKKIAEKADRIIEIKDGRIEMDIHK